jgi:hypothetical protein
MALVIKINEKPHRVDVDGDVRKHLPLRHPCLYS